MKQYIHVGAAGWGLEWLKRFIPQTADIAQWVAVVDIDPQAAQNGVSYLNLPPERCYTDLNAALDAHPVDFVTIASGIASHEEVVMTVLKRGGIHILSEKPLSDTFEGSARIYNAVKASGIKFAVTMSHRYEIDKQTLLAAVRSGVYGPVNYIVGRVHLGRPRPIAPESPRRERALNYLLIDGGVHNLDMVRALSGSNAAQVYTDMWQFNPGDPLLSGRSSFVCAQMENGVRAHLEYMFDGASTLNGWSKEYFRVECANATVEIDNMRVTARSVRGFPVPELSNIPLLPGPHWDHSLLMRQFINWLDGGPAPEVTIEDSIYAMAMLFAAVKSASTGQVVDTREFRA